MLIFWTLLFKKYNYISNWHPYLLYLCVSQTAKKGQFQSQEAIQITHDLLLV